LEDSLEIQLLSSSLSNDSALFVPIGAKVHTHSRRRLRRPATGVSGQESLSESDEDESRFSPVRGKRKLLSSDEFDKVGELDCSEAGGEEEDDDEVVSINAAEDADEEKMVVSDFSSKVEPVSMEEIVDDEEAEEAISECAMVYFVVVISSSKGARNDTRFVAGNMGREPEAILRGRI